MRSVEIDYTRSRVSWAMEEETRLLVLERRSVREVSREDNEVDAGRAGRGDFGHTEESCRTIKGYVPGGSSDRLLLKGPMFASSVAPHSTLIVGLLEDPCTGTVIRSMGASVTLGIPNVITMCA